MTEASVAGIARRGRARVGLRQILFTVRGSIIRVIAWRVGALTLFAGVVAWWAKSHINPLARFGPEPFAFIGTSISVFMSFRNNACFDRWWEARKQWGRLIVAARSLARETLGVVPSADRERILKGVCAYARTLLAKLRLTDEAAAAASWSQSCATRPPGANVANVLLEGIGVQCSLLAQRSIISEWRYMLLETRLTEMADIQAACERISNTPLPFGYTLLIHRTTYLFCGLLPFGLVASLGWGAPLLVMVVSYAFFGLDAIGDELEDPFGHDQNDLPLEDLVATIEQDIAASLATP